MGKDGSPKHYGQFDSKRNRLTWILGVSGLCILSYIMGAWKNTPSPNSQSEILSKVDCNVGSTTSGMSSSATNLNFESHHQIDVNDSGGAQEFPPCDMSFSEYTPCQDPVRGRKFDRNMLKYRERHCPAKEELLNCLIPAPPKYKTPFKWPQSRDYAWVCCLYLIPSCTVKVASWGAYLLKRDIIAMSFAPRDTHEAQVQFALERGVPAMIGIMASQRIPYPARAFDMAHCSRCLIPWHKFDGLYLIEVDRVLRPGGYWILSGPPIRWKKYWRGWERTEEDLKQEQDAIEEVAKRICWTKVVEKDDLSIWQKPKNHVGCAQTKQIYKTPHMCQSDNPDMAWYQNMEKCITPLPEVNSADKMAGGALEKWPKRAFAVPPRISSGSIPSIDTEKFQKDNEVWRERIAHYKHLVPLSQGRYRNVMDMNAYLGGFAAALIKFPVWVMNVVPPNSDHDTLGAIYERGFIGTYHDWCEAFSTYPRTYDLIHASNVFGIYQDRCNITQILLEMDRILRPEGTVIFRETVELLVKIKSITDGMKWKSNIIDHESGPFNPEKILVAEKAYWTGEAKEKQN
ncbi:hypothetical protein JHK85_014044 [Glycine max]|nr:hypothetical protein JHK85_014044 [Glycine max]